MVNEKKILKLNVAIIYEENDFEKNKYFANKLIESFYEYKCSPKLFLIKKNIDNKINLDSFDIIVNRTRLTNFLPKKEEILIFNEPEFTTMANNKFETFLWAKLNKINVLPTQLFNVKNMKNFPFILKEVSSYGGKEVYKINELIDIDKINMINKKYIMQEYLKEGNIDIRVYVMFKKILCSIKRTTNDLNEFRSNFSINKNAKKFYFSFWQKKEIKKIIKKLPLGFYGIDFFIDAKKKLILNEIEDVVGSRMIYHLNLKLDIPKLFVKYLLKNIKKVKKQKNFLKFFN